jgi:prepilin-type N-terminal cleavage/methylation domain-containing protein
MVMRFRRRLDETARQGGFTVVELLVVIIVLGLLSAVAVPSYMGLRERANNNAARANVQDALPAVDAYRAVHGSFAGMALPKLLKLDDEVRLDSRMVVTTRTYCVRSTVGTQTWSLSGPAEDAAPASGGCAERS